LYERKIANKTYSYVRADHDRDRKLNLIELRYWMEKRNRPISQRDTRHILEVTDQDEDETLSFNEFLKFCQRIGLKDNGHSHEDASILDCLEDENIPIHQVRTFIQEDGSYTHLKTEIWSNVEYFKDKVNS
jgi:Ca2+-binding EF-hand superfamily protein